MDKQEADDMDLSIVTVQDCMEMYQYRDMAVILNDGLVLGFKGKECDKAAGKGVGKR